MFVISQTFKGDYYATYLKSSWYGQTHFSSSTFSPVKWGPLFSLTEVGVIRVATPQLLAWVKGSELEERESKSQ